jgi:hypothetical protein
MNECNINDCKILQKHLEDKVQTSERLLNEKIININKSIDLASVQLNERLNGMNEFREALKDQSQKYLTKDEFNIQHLRVQDDIRILRESKAQLEGKASQTSVLISYAIALISLIIAIISYYHKM